MSTLSFSPKIGIALAAYRPDPEIFAVQLQSIADQTYKNWFCVITLDSELAPLKNEPALKRFFEDSRFSWSENRERLGVEENFATSIALCAARDAKVISCSDQDDIWHLNKLERMIAHFEKLPPLSVLHCDMRILLLKDNKYEIVEGTAWEIERRGVQNVSPTDLIIRNVVAGTGQIFDVELARRYPKVPKGVMEHDHWFAFVGALNGGVYPLHEALYDYRIHGTNNSGLSEYPGFFGSSKDIAKLGYLAKLNKVYGITYKRLLTAKSVGFKNKLTEWMIASPWDFGSLFLIKALFAFPSDPALARACVARALGKLINLRRIISNKL